MDFSAWEKDWDNPEDAVYDKKMVCICTGCMKTYGDGDGADYCRECKTYKYFEWIEEEEVDGY